MKINIKSRNFLYIHYVLTPRCARCSTMPTPKASFAASTVISVTSCHLPRRFAGGHLGGAYLRQD